MIAHSPNVKKRSFYSASEAIRILQISRGKFYKAVKKGSKNGGLDGTIRKDNGRLQFTGAELLRYWRG